MRICQRRIWKGVSQESSRAFTLLELVISAAVSAMILVGAYACLNAAFASQKMVEPRSEVFQTARVALNLMSADLHAACPLSKEFEFLGMQRMMDDGTEADNLDFATHNYTPRRPREGDYCQMSYFLQKSTNGYSLWRRRNPVIALDPLDGGTREEIAQGLVGLRFEYYDGYDWCTSWGKSVQDTKKGIAEVKETSSRTNSETGNLSGMPQAVRITLFFDPEPLKKREDIQTTNTGTLVFQTVARLELADANSNAQGASVNTQ